MAKTAVSDLRPCWRCDGITFWRARDGAIHCAQCSPPHAHYLIAQRLRAVPAPPSQLTRAMRFILLQLKGAGSVNAKSVIDAGGAEEDFGGYSDSSADAVADSFPEATLGLDVGPAAAMSARFCRLTSALRRPHSESCCGVAPRIRANAAA